MSKLVLVLAVLAAMTILAWVGKGRSARVVFYLVGVAVLQFLVVRQLEAVDPERWAWWIETVETSAYLCIVGAAVGHLYWYWFVREKPPVDNPFAASSDERDDFEDWEH